ncbi:MAG: thioredoxin family protein, partial [Bacteroidota bacterium]|nr:thioredoxin family protein [Bacteroidota bacterium]
MARAPRWESVMIPLGTEAPDFSLPDTVSGKQLRFADVAGEKGTVVMFICNHCPFVQHVNPELVRIAHEYISKGIGFVGISSNDVETHPEDCPEQMKEQAEKVGYPFPYLYDETQQVALAYDAACTPDFFVFDKNKKLVYRGRLDNSTPRNNQPLTGKDLRDVLEAVV